MPLYLCEIESFLKFEGTHIPPRALRKGVERVFVGGLATDYRVKHTMPDALKMGFETILLEDAIWGVDIKPGNSKRAVEEMVKRGAKKAAFSGTHP